MTDPFLPAMEAVCKALDVCPRCKGSKVVTLFDVDLGGGFRGDADDQPCPECEG